MVEIKEILVMELLQAKAVDAKLLFHDSGIDLGIVQHSMVMVKNIKDSMLLQKVIVLWMKLDSILQEQEY